MTGSFEQITDYLQTYISAYKQEYIRFTSPPPKGGGYPALPISPYLYSSNLRCLVLKDGVLIIDMTKEPEYPWYIDGGPAIKIDYEPTRTPLEVIDIQKKEGILGKPLGIYRIVAKHQLSPETWSGNLGTSIQQAFVDLGEGRTLTVEAYELTLNEAIRRLTFGAFGDILDIHLPDASADFWIPHIVRNIGFFPADLNSRAFYHYFEIIPHRDLSAWDKRGIQVRLRFDIRRDFAYMLAEKERGSGAGLLSFGAPNDWAEQFNNRLNRLRDAIEGFENLLTFSQGKDEDVFHDYLTRNSILLDVYGTSISKPRFVYPEGEASPIGKKYVEPDFIVVYPNNTYKLVELERPSKQLATKQGHPRQDFNQAAFQTGEWVHYIKNYYHLLKDTYPGIASNHTTTVIMSRSIQDTFENEKELRGYIEMIKETSAVDEILTYDDLLNRAKAAYSRLVSLGLRESS